MVIQQKSTNSNNLRIGSRRQVMNGTAKITGGRLTKRQLKYNKRGKIVSRKASRAAKKSNNLVKAGYITRKGVFGVIKKGGSNGLSSNLQDMVKQGLISKKQAISMMPKPKSKTRKMMSQPHRTRKMMPQPHRTRKMMPHPQIIEKNTILDIDKYIIFYKNKVHELSEFNSHSGKNCWMTGQLYYTEENIQLLHRDIGGAGASTYNDTVLSSELKENIPVFHNKALKEKAKTPNSIKFRFTIGYNDRTDEVEFILKHMKTWLEKNHTCIGFKIWVCGNDFQCGKMFDFFIYNHQMINSFIDYGSKVILPGLVEAKYTPDNCLMPSLYNFDLYQKIKDRELSENEVFKNRGLREGSFMRNMENFKIEFIISEINNMFFTFRSDEMGILIPSVFTEENIMEYAEENNTVGKFYENLGKKVESSNMDQYFLADLISKYNHNMAMINHKGMSKLRNIKVIWEPKEEAEAEAEAEPEAEVESHVGINDRFKNMSLNDLKNMSLNDLKNKYSKILINQKKAIKKNNFNKIRKLAKERQIIRKYIWNRKTTKMNENEKNLEQKSKNLLKNLEKTNINSKSAQQILKNFNNISRKRQKIISERKRLEEIRLKLSLQKTTKMNKNEKNLEQKTTKMNENEKNLELKSKNLLKNLEKTNINSKSAQQIYSKLNIISKKRRKIINERKRLEEIRLKLSLQKY